MDQAARTELDMSFNIRNIQEEQITYRYWHVVYTKPKAEVIARENLENQGFSVLLPEALVTKVQRGKRIKMVEPLFPRYIFVQVKPEQCIGKIRSTIGCTSLVRFEHEKPSVLPSDIVEDLFQLSKQDQILIDPDMPKAGQTMFIEKGIYRNNIAVYIEPCGDKRSWLLLEMLGAKGRLMLNNCQFRPQ